MDEAERQARELVGRWAQGWMVAAHTDDAEQSGRWTGTFLNGAIPELEERIAGALRTALAAQARAEEERDEARRLLIDANVALTEEQQRNDAARRQARDVVTERDTLAQLGERLAASAERAEEEMSFHAGALGKMTCSDCVVYRAELTRDRLKWTKARGKGE
jgi:uncharacterized membrane protein